MISAEAIRGNFITSVSNEKGEPWDAGEEILLGLKSSPYFQYDMRDIFNVDKALKISQKLVELDPTCIASYSYVALLLKTAFQRINISLFDAVLNEHFVDYAAEMRVKHDTMIARSNRVISDFTESVQQGFEQATGARFTLNENLPPESRSHENISKDDITKLLKDALIATEMPVTWIYGNGQSISKNDAHIRLQSEIMLFPNMLSLEAHIRQHKFEYGLRCVTINAASKNRNKLDLFVFTSPSHAFILGEFSWSRHENLMVSSGGAGYQYQRDGLTYADNHFPELDLKKTLSVISKKGQVIGDIKSCEDKVTIWLLLLTEMISIKLPDMQPTNCESSIELLQYKGVSQYPVVSNLPYQLDDLSLADIIEKVGINKSDHKETLLKLIKGVELFIEVLPSDGKLYLDPMTMERFDSHSKPTFYSEVGERIIKLYPFPNHHFGSKEQAEVEIEWVACENLALIINTKFRILWLDALEEQRKWFISTAKKKGKLLKSKIDDLISRPVERNESNLEMRDNFWTSVITDNGVRYVAYAIDSAQMRHEATLKLPLNIPALYRSNEERELLGYFTEECEPTRVLLAFNSSEEIMETFNCRRSSLPPLLQNWTRKVCHDQLEYPWSRQSRNEKPFNWGTFSIYL